ncbi:MAG: GTP 3',8-cyclase MoaA, partial [Deltaproteobacteria bacterium]|nr:GTP 3',8-cyclase MoaA [Deltaproteobacteria bacterium]
MAPNIDNLGRAITYLRLSVTDRCNLRCIYCMPASGVPKRHHQDILTFEELLRVARVAAGSGIRKIRVTGGEPLVRRGIIDLISRLNQIPGIEEITLTTNGLLLAQAAADLKAAGISRINISLDSLNPVNLHRITRADVFRRVWAGIEAADQVGFSPIKINVVALRGINDREILDFARLARERPFQIRFIELMPSAENAGWARDRLITIDEIKDLIETTDPLIPIEREVTSGPALRYRQSGAKGEIGLIGPVSRHFCPTCNRLRLT